jgi:hypothetical protein
MSASALPSASNSLPDRFYYLKNFTQVLGWIEQRYGDLLRPDQARFIEAFRTLPQPSQALLTRMAMRKSDVFRSTRLHYDEIGPLPPALGPLFDAGLVTDQPALSIDELFALLNKPELVPLFELPRGAAQLAKSELLDMLRPGCAEARPLHAWGASETAYRLLAAGLCEGFRLLYFGNFHQTWSEFVLADMGIFRYEQVALTQASRAFQSSAQIDAFQRIYRCRQRLQAGAPPGEVVCELPGTVGDSAWIEQRRQKMLFRIAQRFEALRQPQEALQLYRACAHPGAPLRAALILERAGDAATAHEVCMQGLQLRHEAAFHPRLQRVLRRLQRGRGGARTPRSAHADVLVLHLPHPGADVRVELAAASHLGAAEPESRVFYVENSLINSLFGLLCWDAVFAPLPGAFFHPFHRGPADLLAPDFQERRRELFDACLASLADARHHELIRRRFEQKNGIQSPFVHWGALDPGLLELALQCMPAAHLRAWFEWILRDVGSNSAGFPDLVQFWPSQRRYRLVEIKGPGDHLQENQRRLLEYCAAHDLPVAVAHVKWTSLPAVP